MTLVYKQYMGDGVYASFDGYSVWLTTENGIAVSNTICLEPTVWVQITAYWPQAREHVEKLNAQAKTCGQDGCDDPAAFTFIWPGEKQKQRCCTGHRSTVEEVAAALGVEPYLEAIP